MAEFPALPLWTDAYMLDCGHLTDAEHGRYLRILILMWHSPQCRIPNDPEWIARKLNRSVEDYHSQIAPLISEFCYSTGNWLEQKRLIKEYKYLQGQSKKQSDNAKSRWNKDKSISQTHPKPMPNASQTDAPTPTPTPTPISAVARDAFEETDDALRRIEGIENHPVFVQPVIAPIWQLVQQGLDLKTQITPSIRRQLKNINGKRITTWGYFVPGIIEDAKPANSTPVGIATPEKWAERMEWARKNNQWGTVWGPMPGQTGCAVPAGLIKPTDGKGWTEWKSQA